MPTASGWRESDEGGGGGSPGALGDGRWRSIGPLGARGREVEDGARVGLNAHVEHSRRRAWLPQGSFPWARRCGRRFGGCWVVAAAGRGRARVQAYTAGSVADGRDTLARAARVRWVPSHRAASGMDTTALDGRGNAAADALARSQASALWVE